MVVMSESRWVSRFWASVWVGVTGVVGVVISVYLPSGANSKIFLLSPMIGTVEAVVFFSPICKVESGWVSKSGKTLSSMLA